MGTMVSFHFQNEEDFLEVKRKAEELYATFGDVYCPYFKEKIAFNSLGMKHLKFKRDEKNRPLKDQYMRFRLLYLAPEIIKSSHTLQGIFETKRFEQIRIHNRTDTILIPVNYYEFVAIVKGSRIKIVVKQVGEGQKFFWSLIPLWGMNKSTKVRILHEGIPEED